MRKTICILLSFMLCFCNFPLLAFAQNTTTQYTDDEKEFICMKYTANEHMLDALFNDDTAIGYWNLVNDTEENGALSWSIDVASKLIEEYPDKQKYAEILANLITMQSGDIAEQIQTQSNFDDLKDGMDYAMDIVEIATSFVGGAKLLETVSPIIDVATGGAEVIIDNVEQAKYYETTIQDYSQSKNFLEAVSKYAENVELREVATSLLAANDTLLQKRLEYLTDVSGTLIDYEAKFFVENMSFELLKHADLYKSDDTVKWYVDCGSKLKDSILSIKGAGEFAFKMTMLAGNIGFGTSDTFNRYQEMKIVSDIAGAIVEANSQIIVPQDADSDLVLPDIQAKCDYYKMLITVHARGEYLIYQLLVNDASLLSDFRVIFDYFKDPEDTTDSWYAGQIECLTEYYDILDKMFSLSGIDVPHGLYDIEDVPDNAVEFNGHYYYIYDFAGLSPDESNTWENALGYCNGINGYLATITSQEENDFLYSYVKQEGYSSAYFGLSDTTSEGNWTWNNGEAVSYTNWHRNEPNGEKSSEDYALFYYKYSDGTWNDGDFGNRTVSGGTAFICEWGEYTVASGNAPVQEPVRTTSDERDIVLVLDVSGSMSGTPMTETKKASANFIDTILDEDASIGIVTYDNSATMLSDFSVNKTVLNEAVSSIWDGGGTNIEAGLAEAHSMLNTSGAKKKIIVLMSDGEPNEGKEGDELIFYADAIKNDGIIIYTLGFFESLGSYKSSAQLLMEGIASDGCHYEVASADDLVFFFEDMADQINGQKYIYIRIACPVDVTVTHNGETLCSAEDDLNVRTDFGTLTFEDNEEVTNANEDDRIKVLRLKEGTDYDVQIVGTGHGLMDYTIGFMDENGDYSDFRRFENIKITRRTEIDTVAAVSKESVLNIDKDGDGKYDLKLRAEENGYGEEVKSSFLIYAITAGAGVLLLLIIILIVRMNRKNKE